MLLIEEDWKAFKKNYQSREATRKNQRYFCLYVWWSRGQNELADYLARKGRLQNWDCTGFYRSHVLEVKETDIVNKIGMLMSCM